MVIPLTPGLDLAAIHHCRAYEDGIGVTNIRYSSEAQQRVTGGSDLPPDNLYRDPSCSWHRPASFLLVRDNFHNCVKVTDNSPESGEQTDLISGVECGSCAPFVTMKPYKRHSLSQT